MSHPNDGTDTSQSRRNRLLASLSAEQYQELLPHLERIDAAIKDVIYRPYEPIPYVVFPESGVHSLLSVGDEGELIEVATIGDEGFVGLPIFLGADSTPGLAIVQVPGTAIRIESAAFREAVARDANFAAVLNRYTLALFNQIAQAAFCNRVHPMEQRCARWMLMTQDRAGDEFPLTPEFLSQMLGVRRATVTEAVGALQQRELLTYTRGIMRIIDRAGLEAASCECYRIIKEEFDRLVGS